MSKKTYSYSEYMDSSKELFKQLFGEELFDKLNSVDMKSIDWEGIDVTTSQITATNPNIKDRFSKEWVEYFEERNYTLFDLYLQSVFHYGFQQHSDNNRDSTLLKLYQDIIKSLTKK
jgi:hypothetical protein